MEEILKLGLFPCINILVVIFQKNLGKIEI